ncbi:hypothetical protein EVAR_95794_1 [Eumeta japonica]|uniref:Uncharacterized protein n=1 Tax=Eumeta variegata TaxID=151549 RepID=A0A4C1W273_EUMVA|nr:hypothetical protein EVAR_95794_1 [Eumeta japonica]
MFEEQIASYRGVDDQRRPWPLATPRGVTSALTTPRQGVRHLIKGREIGPLEGERAECAGGTLTHSMKDNSGNRYFTSVLCEWAIVLQPIWPHYGSCPDMLYDSYLNFFRIAQITDHRNMCKIK